MWSVDSRVVSDCVNRAHLMVQAWDKHVEVMVQLLFCSSASYHPCVGRCVFNTKPHGELICFNHIPRYRERGRVLYNSTWKIKTPAHNSTVCFCILIASALTQSFTCSTRVTHTAFFFTLKSVYLKIRNVYIIYHSGYERILHRNVHEKLISSQEHGSHLASWRWTDLFLNHSQEHLHKLHKMW